MLLHARRNQIILMEQQKVYEVEKGLVFVWEVQADGKQSLTDILQQGMVAECPVTAGTVYELRVQASARIRLHSWPPLPQHPEQMMRLLLKLRTHSSRSLQLAVLLRQKYIRERLELFMAFLNQHFSVPFQENRRLVPFVLTHEDMASAVNSTRSTITRMMNALEREGQISHAQQAKKRLLVLLDASTADTGMQDYLANPMY